MAKKKVKATEKPVTIGTAGTCKYCDARWDRHTVMDGWELDKRTGDWVSCPGCSTLRKAIATAKKNDKKLYMEWLDCTCKQMFDVNLKRTKPHVPGCKVRR